MITIEQVKLLEEKVESLINVVKSLYRERDLLKGTVAQNEKRIEELESVLHSFEISQAKIEESVMNALNQLDVFENSVTQDSSTISSSREVEASDSSLSHSSELGKATEESLSNATNENAQNTSSEGSEIKKVDDSDKQMDIF